ncbi:MAG: 2-dehydropantoate 2-reductase [Bacteroidia bacterium]|nr:2-dehydropantoate 2-reductase [Bacteroidia bacterium]MCC7532383.1 2-dehydropantoate 2-reductase [Bacteroidia bacterium]
MSSKHKIRVGIIGLGPVGMILAVKLQKAGCEVALCVRNEVKRNKIIHEGIKLENVFTDSAKFKDVYENIEDFINLDLDYLIFAVKTYHVPTLLSAASALITEKLTVVSAQNGIDTEHLYTSTFGEGKILRMVVNFAGSPINPNTVKVSFFTAPNYIGSINDSRRKQADELANLLTLANVDTDSVTSFDLVKRVWHKTILNSSLSALCGVGRLTMAEAMSDPDTVELIEQTISEAVGVAETEKIRFDDNFIRECMRYLKKGGDHFPSLALDLINGRETEIDFFNGKIVEYGRKHYVRASLNLSFTNMVNAMTNKNIISRMPGITNDINRKILNKGLIINSELLNQYKKVNCFLGIDLGSAYTKFSVIDDRGKALFRYFLPTLNNDKQAFKNVMQTISSNFNISMSCATGYGRKHFNLADIVKTEINCAAAGVSFLYAGEKNIIDIGGEDIKIIRCDKDDNVLNFYMNDKCAAGTGAFLSEIAERASIQIAEMSTLASLSNYDKELNSFCTVFAKTEIMNWIFDGMSMEDISRGVYNSIANKIAKMRIDPGIPTYMVGGVIAHHPYLKHILSEKFNLNINVIEAPQFVVSYGAAVIAAKTFAKKGKAIAELTEEEQ